MSNSKYGVSLKGNCTDGYTLYINEEFVNYLEFTLEKINAIININNNLKVLHGK